jgi:hypothetical protein
VAREGGEGGGCGRLSSCRRRLRVLLLPATCENGNWVLRGVLGRYFSYPSHAENS